MSLAAIRGLDEALAGGCRNFQCRNFLTGIFLGPKTHGAIRLDQIMQFLTLNYAEWHFFILPQILCKIELNMQS